MMPPVPVWNFIFFLIEPFVHIFGTLFLSVFPGWGLATRLKLDPLTKLLISVMGSYTLMYLLEFAAYLASAPQWLPLSLLLICSLASVLYARFQSQSSQDKFPWEGILAWGGLAVWILGMQSQVTVYGAVSWFGDWYEHYERSIFFLDQSPPSTRFLSGLWSLPARGPLFNACAALLMSQFGRDFWVYQTIATVLNTFPVLPMALLIRDMAKTRQSSALLWSSILFGVAPFAVQQETFTWTKFFAVGFILGGIHLYRLALSEERPRLASSSFGVFAAGILAHYFTFIFALFPALHFISYVLRNRFSLRTVLYPAIGCSVLVATWFVYLFLTFGIEVTLRANSTLGDYARHVKEPQGKPLIWKEVFWGNIVTTTLPYSWRHGIEGLGNAPYVRQADPRAGPKFTPAIEELNRKAEWLSDLVNNPNTLLGALGWAGGLGLLMAAVLVIRRKQNEEELNIRSHTDLPEQKPGWIFWFTFFALGIPLNIAAVPDYSAHGTAHLNLQPFLCLTCVLLLRWLKQLPVALKLLLSTIFLIESALTTGALMALEARPVPLILGPEGKFLVLEKLGLNPIYVNNYLLKLGQKVVFLSDRLGDLAGPFSLIAATVALGLFVCLKNWPLWSGQEGEA